MKLTEAKHTKLNHFGVKNSADMWRTIKGEHYNQWASELIHDRAKAYRAAGVKCAIRNGELFVRNADQDLARSIDAAASRAALSNGETSPIEGKG